MANTEFASEVTDCIRDTCGDIRTFLFWKIVQKHHGLPVNFYDLEILCRQLGLDVYFSANHMPNKKILSINGRSEYMTIAHIGYGKPRFESEEEYNKNLDLLKISGVMING